MSLTGVRLLRNSRSCLAVSALFLACIPCGGLEFFVGPGGDDEGPGTRAAPFATLEGARDALRVLANGPGLPEEGVTVTLLPGRYRRMGSFSLRKQDSGTASAPIVYRAEEGARVRLTGGISIQDFRPVRDADILRRLPVDARDQVFQADLRSLGVADFGELKPRGMGLAQHGAALELFFDGRPMPLARWPNEGFVLTGDVLDTGSRVFSKGSAQGFIDPHKPEPPRPGRFRFADPRPRRWTDAEDIWVHGYWGRDWSEEHLPVAEIDAEAGVVTMGHPTRYGHYSGKRFYFLNLLEELDRPGEWFLDRESGILYFWPPGPPASSEASVSVLAGVLLDLREVSHVIFRGLVLEQTRGSAIAIHGGTGVLVAGCTIRNIGNRAVGVFGGHGHAVIGCDIRDTGDGGILLRGGDRRSLEPGAHRAENNHITRYSRWCRTYRPAISLQGVGNAARHNLIHDSAHMAVSIGGNDHVFELNEVHSVVRETTDSSALYTGGNPTARGNVIRHNYWHHIGSGLRHSGQSAVYLDDGLSGTAVIGNIFYRVGGSGSFGATMVNGGKDNVFENNAFIDCRLGLRFSTWSATVWRDYLQSDKIRAAFASVEAAGSLYLERYPELATVAEDPGVNLVRRNLWYGCEATLSERPEGRVIRDRNVEVDENPGFVSPERGDFRMFEPSAELVAVGFEPIPFDQIGLRPSPERASWPVEHAVLPLRQSGLGETRSRERSAPVFTVQRSQRPRTIDGRLEPGEWGSPAQAMRIAEQPDGKPALPASHVWIAHDGDHLLLAVSVPLAGVSVRLGRRWRDDDAVELAVRNGTSDDDAPILVLRGYAGGHLESSGEAGAAAAAVALAARDVVYVARVIENDRWTAEWRIPFASLGGIEWSAASPIRLPFNFTVRKTAGPLWQMWRGTRGYSWLVDRAGFLELAE